jgi:hypothetical protein
MRRKAKFSGIIISHLGNIDGREVENENRLKYLKAALTAGWHICADVIFRNGGFLLPHQNGFDAAPLSFFSQSRVWSRCRDAETLDALCNVKAHAFFISDAGHALTSEQFIWTLPPENLVDRSIAAFPELAPDEWLEKQEPAGLCSNTPIVYV